MTQHIKTFYSSDMKSELKVFHRLIEWVNFVWMQDLYVLLRLDSISWQKTMENNFTQRLVVNTLFQEVTDHHNQKDGSRETQKVGPVLEVTTSCLYGKHGVEIRIWSLSEDNNGVEIRIWSPSEDNTHSWVRISHGSNKFVMDSNSNDTEIPEDLPEEQALQLKVKDFACRSKAKAKPQRREPVDYSPSTIPMNERKWIDIETGNYSLSAYEVSKKVIHLLRHSQTVQRKDDGAVQFWRIKKIFRIYFHKFLIGPTIVGKHAWQQEEEQKGDISTALMIQEQLFTSELFKDIQDAISLILLLQDNVVIQRGFYPHIYHIGCAFNLHSIINNGLIPGGQNSSKRQTVFFLPIDPRDKGHQDPEKIDFIKPCRAQYLHSA